MFHNNATVKRRELLTTIARLALRGELTAQIDALPSQMFPKHGASTRCCVHKSRAILRQRLRACLGFSVEANDDDQYPLSWYAAQAETRPAVSEPIFTVIDEACSACVRTHYQVTNACRGCLARPCLMNCPKKAIEMVDGQARIDPAKCVNCGLCQKACPYHAIIYMPIPCEEVCPVGAISKDELGLEVIDPEKCIACGKCVQSCPFGAIMEKSQLVDVIQATRAGRPVMAMVAPSIVGQFPGSWAQLVTAIQQAGFCGVREVALGADQAAADEAREWRERIDAGEPFMTSSCCPAFTAAVEKHVPELAGRVSHTRSPMHYTAAQTAAENPEAVRVFIGPCMAKRREALADPLVDYVLTFEELGALFIARDIDVARCAEAAPAASAASRAGREFPISGGVTAAIQAAVGEDARLRPILVDGLDKKQIRMLKTFTNGQVPGTFIEVMSCEGGCVAGPGVISPAKISARKIRQA